MADNKEVVINFVAKGVDKVMSDFAAIQNSISAVSNSRASIDLTRILGKRGGIQAYGPLRQLTAIADEKAYAQRTSNKLASIGVYTSLDAMVKQFNRENSATLKEMIRLEKAKQKAANDERKKLERSQKKELREYESAELARLRAGSDTPAGRKEYLIRKHGQKAGSEIFAAEQAARERKDAARASRKYDKDWRAYKLAQLKINADTPEGRKDYLTYKFGPIKGTSIFETEQEHARKAAQIAMGQPNVGPQIDENLLQARLGIMGPNEGPQIEKGLLKERLDFGASLESAMEGGRFNREIAESIGSGFGGLSGNEMQSIAKAVEEGAARGTEKGTVKAGRAERRRTHREHLKRQRDIRSSLFKGNYGPRGILQGLSGSALGSFASKPMGWYDNIFGGTATSMTRLGAGIGIVVDIAKMIHKSNTEYAKYRTNIEASSVMSGMSASKATELNALGNLIGGGTGGSEVAGTYGSLNVQLQRMRMGEGGGGLEKAALKYGLDITGTGKGGLATVDEIYARIASGVDKGRWDDVELADMFSTLGIDQYTAMALKRGSKEFERLRNRAIRVSDPTGQGLNVDRVRKMNEAMGALEETKKRAQGAVAEFTMPAETAILNAVPDALSTDGASSKVWKSQESMQYGPGGLYSFGASLRKGKVNSEAAKAAAASDGSLTSAGQAAVGSGVMSSSQGGGAKVEVTMENVSIQTSSDHLTGTGREFADGFSEQLGRSITNNFGHAKA